MKKMISVIPLVFLICFTFSCQDKEAMAELEAMKAQAEIEEQNKEVVRQFVAAYNSGDFDRLDEFMMIDLVRHSQAAGVEENTLEEYKEYLRQIAEAFPDARDEIRVIIAEADKVVAYGTWTATQEGPYGPFPATGKKTNVQFFYLFRMEGGKIAEFWTEWDNLNMLSQLGHYPPSPGT